MCVRSFWNVYNVQHMLAHAFRDQKRALDALELEFQVVVSHLIWMLGTQAKDPRALELLSHLSSPITGIF